MAPIIRIYFLKFEPTQFFSDIWSSKKLVLELESTITPNGRLSEKASE